jgi:DNA-binding transcriptional LysR family regulator
VRPSHPLAGQGPVGLEAVTQQGWALAGAGSFRQAFAAHFTALNAEPPRRIVQCSSIALLIEIVANGDFLTILPDAIANAPPLRGRLVKIESEIPAGHPYGGLVYRQDRLDTPAAQALQAIFREVGRDLAGAEG